VARKKTKQKLKLLQGGFSTDVVPLLVTGHLPLVTRKGDVL